MTPQEEIAAKVRERIQQMKAELEETEEWNRKAPNPKFLKIIALTRDSIALSEQFLERLEAA